MNTKFFKIFIVILIMLVAGVEAFWFFAVPALCNNAVNSTKLQTIIDRNFGFKFLYKNLQFRTYPNFTLLITADELDLRTEENSPLFCRNLNLRFKLLPLLWKKNVIESINADTFNLKIHKDKNKNIFLGKYLLKQSQVRTFPHLEIKNLSLQDVHLYFTDNEYNKSYFLKFPSIESIYQKKEKFYLKTDAKLFVNNVFKTTLVLDYEINSKTKQTLDTRNNIVKVLGFDIASFNDYIAEICKQDFVNTQGIVDLTITDNEDNSYKLEANLKNLHLIAKDRFESVNSKDAILLNTIFDIDGPDLNIKEAKIKGKSINIMLNGSIKNYLTRLRQADLTVKFVDTSFNDLYWLCPSLPQDEFDVVHKLKQYGFWGIINGIITVQGDFSKPELHGDVVVSDVYIVKDNPIVPHSKIDLKFIKDKVEINTKIFTGFGEYVDVNGVSELKTYPKGDFFIESSPSVDLSIVSYMLVPIHKIVGFDLGPVPYMNLKGKGNIRLKTNGTILDGNAYGKLNFKNVDAVLQGLNLTLQNTTGFLDFSGRDLHFCVNDSYINNQKVIMDGNANLDGNVDLNVNSENIDISDLFNILSTSEVLKTKRSIAQQIVSASGPTSAQFKIKGVVKDYADVLKENNLDIQGRLKLKNCRVVTVFSPLAIEKITGVLNFKDIDWQVDLKSFIVSTPLYIKGGANKLGTNLKINASNIKTEELLQKLNLPNMPKLSSLISFAAVHKSFDRSIHLDKIKANFELRKQNPTVLTDFIVGSLSLNNGVLSTKDLIANIQNSNIHISGKISNLFASKYNVNGRLKVDEFNLAELNKIKESYILPKSLADVLNTYEQYKGFADLDLNCVNNRLNGIVNFKDISFNHSYYKTPVSVDTGKLIIKASQIYLDSVIAKIDNNPMYINLSIWDLDKTAKINGYFTSKITEDFVNKYINNKLTYPIKIKGDVTLTTDISGNLNNLRLRPKIKLDKNSDIYYMGSNIGNDDEERELIADFNVLQNNKYKVKKIDYIRYIKSQDGYNHPLHVITGNGSFSVSGNDFYFDDFNVETPNKANAKLFNLIFKKSIIKNGLFNCKLKINGPLNKPQIRGFVDIFNIEIPLYDTVVKNILVNFRPNVIDITTEGIALNSDYTLKASLQNNIELPIQVEELEIISQNINLDTLIDYIAQVPAPNSSLKLVDKPSKNNRFQLDVDDIRIKNGHLIAKEMIIKDLLASNFKADFSLGDGFILQLPKITFDITTGNITGSATYDFVSEKIKTNMTALNVDSNKIASSLFGFKDQLIGSANGNFSIVTRGHSYGERLKNMSGFVYFEVADGKMPKLGSVEYLLRAGNFIKSGLMGVSINNIIDILSPVKTGDFETIKGALTLKNGVAQNVELYSKGNNLNLFINGEFDILHQYADMKVYGRLKQKDNGFFGKVGNLSFNSIISQIPGFRLDENEKEKLLNDLNKIPGVEMSDNKYKNFTVKIEGNINEDKYVKNFRWID